MSVLDAASATTVKAVHTWSLFRTLGRFVAPGSMPSGGLPEGGGGGLPLLELPAELARHGYSSAQLCHFYLPRTELGYLNELRAAFDDAAVTVECFLVDDGDLTDPTDGDRHRDWLSSWMEVAEELGIRRVRVVAGMRPPTPDSMADSARRLVQLADRHRGTRVLVENWHTLLRDAAAVNDLLGRTGGEIGFLVDLGNWSGPAKYADLAAVAARAESCQAKVATDPAGAIDADDYRRSLTALRDAGYTGPLAMVYDGTDPREWDKLDEAHNVLQSVFPPTES